MRVAVLQADADPALAAHNDAAATARGARYTCISGSADPGGGLAALLRSEAAAGAADWALCLGPDEALQPGGAGAEGLLRADRNDERLLVYAAGDARGAPFPTSDAGERAFLLSLTHPASRTFASLMGATAALRALAAGGPRAPPPSLSRCVAHFESMRAPDTWFNRYWASDPFAGIAGAWAPPPPPPPAARVAPAKRPIM